MTSRIRRQGEDDVTANDVETLKGGRRPVMPRVLLLRGELFATLPGSLIRIATDKSVRRHFETSNDMGDDTEPRKKQEKQF